MSEYIIEPKVYPVHLEEVGRDFPAAATAVRAKCTRKNAVPAPVVRNYRKTFYHKQLLMLICG